MQIPTHLPSRACPQTRQGLKLHCNMECTHNMGQLVHLVGYSSFLPSSEIPALTEAGPRQRTPSIYHYEDDGDDDADADDYYYYYSLSLSRSRQTSESA